MTSAESLRRALSGLFGMLRAYVGRWPFGYIVEEDPNHFNFTAGWNITYDLDDIDDDDDVGECQCQTGWCTRPVVLRHGPHCRNCRHVCADCRGCLEHRDHDMCQAG